MTILQDHSEGPVLLGRTFIQRSRGGFIFSKVLVRKLAHFSALLRSFRFSASLRIRTPNTFLPVTWLTNELVFICEKDAVNTFFSSPAILINSARLTPSQNWRDVIKSNKLHFFWSHRLSGVGPIDRTIRPL